jgi:hypothetical protein
MSLCENCCRVPEMGRFPGTKARRQGLPETKKCVTDEEQCCKITINITIRSFYLRETQNKNLKGPETIENLSTI